MLIRPITEVLVTQRCDLELGKGVLHCLLEAVGGECCTTYVSKVSCSCGDCSLLQAWNDRLVLRAASGARKNRDVRNLAARFHYGHFEDAVLVINHVAGS